MKKKTYEAPRVLKTVTFVMGNPILTGSVAKNVSSVKSMGQDVEVYNANDVSFNHEWDN